jgi:hypothetical protein
MSTHLIWRKSSHSGDASNCVEIATAPTGVHVRDSKRTTDPHLTVRPATWTSFVAALAPKDRAQRTVTV